MNRRKFVLAAGALGLGFLSFKIQSQITPRFADMHGLGPRPLMPSYAEFASLEELLGKRGLKPAEVEGIMGGNYIRVLREAMKT